MNMQRMLSNGRWCDDDRIGQFVDMAASFNGKTSHAIMDQLASGAEVRYDCDWYALIRIKPAPQPERQPDYPNGRILDCGCIVYWQPQVMRASLGTSCSDCYDRMSA